MTNIWILYQKTKLSNLKKIHIKMGKTHLHACARAIYNKVYLKKYQNILPFSCTIQKLYIPLHRQKQNDTHINKKKTKKAHPNEKDNQTHPNDKGTPLNKNIIVYMSKF